MAEHRSAIVILNTSPLGGVRGCKFADRKHMNGTRIVLRSCASLYSPAARLNPVCSLQPFSYPYPGGEKRFNSRRMTWTWPPGIEIPPSAVENPLAEAQKAIRDRVAQGKPAYFNPVEKLDRNPASRKLAIDTMCYDGQGE